VLLIYGAIKCAKYSYVDDQSSDHRLLADRSVLESSGFRLQVTLRRFLTEEDATIVCSHRATSYFSVALATPLQWPIAHSATEDDYG